MADQRHTGNPGNFAENREKASRAGHIGGQHSSGNFANDRERAAEAGRKGGEARTAAPVRRSPGPGRRAEADQRRNADDRDKALGQSKRHDGPESRIHE